jgi:hypothetical protein
MIKCDSKKRSSKYAMKDKDRYDRHVVACVNSDRFNFRFMIVNLIPCEQQLLIELAINFGDFYVMFQRENHFFNKRI